MRSLVLAALLTLAASQCTQTISSCTSDNAIASDVSIFTDPAWETLKPGDTYTSYLSFTLSSPITSGKDKAYATLNGVVVQDKTTDLCTDLKTTDMPCPVAVGPQTSVTTVTIGSVPLSGRLDATINWTTEDDKEILCLETILCVA